MLNISYLRRNYWETINEWIQLTAQMSAFLNLWQWRCHEFMLAPASVSIRLYVFIGLCLYVFSELLQSNRNQKTEKRGRSGFSRKILVRPKIDKKSPKKSFFTYLVLSLLFARGNLKWKTLQFCFPVQT